MHFKIVCTGWRNWPWIKQTLDSIDQQMYRDFEVCVIDDDSGDPRLNEFIPEYCGERGWKWVLQSQRRCALYNQVQAISWMEPDPEDVIVFVDPDGDRLAHRTVLDRLVMAYADGSRLVYSNYDTEPASPTSVRSRPYPRDVIDTNSYRSFTRTHGIYWNHLRTFKADLFYQLDEEDFLDDEGNWFTTVTDSALMFPCLELARGKVKFLDEILLIYRADHELSDWKQSPLLIDRHNHVILTRPPKC